MTNALIIARREIGAALASPVAYVLFGAFAFLYGYFFTEFLRNFVEVGMRMSELGGFSGGSLHVNHDLIHPLLLTAAVVLLFLLPLLTMRLVSGEVRSGTIELLLTAPVSDGQIVLGKFFAGLALYGAMLTVSLLHTAVLFWFGQPDILPVLSGYLGLFLFGTAAIALGLFFSSLTGSQIVAGILTLAAMLLLWVIEFAGQDAGGRLLAYLSLTGHLADLARGVVTTRDIAFYLSFTGLFLLLTRESVHSRRWRG